MTNQDRRWIKSYDEWVDPDLTVPDVSYVELVEDCVRQFPNHPAFHFMGTMLTFRDVDDYSRRFAHFLAEAGCRQGNVVGNPIVPVIKISANPRTVRTMGEHVDLDVSGILRREMTIDQAGDALIDMIRRTANGRHTAAEALGHREFSMTKLYRSA